MLSASSSRLDPISWKIETKRTKKSASSMPTGSWLSSHCGLRRGRLTRSGTACARGTRAVTGAPAKVRSARCGAVSWDGSSHDHLVGGREEQRVLVEADDVLAGAEATAGTQVVLEQQRLLDPLDAVDRLEHLGDRRSVQVGVEGPAAAFRAAGQRVDVARQGLDSALPHEPRRTSRCAVHERCDGHALVI